MRDLDVLVNQVHDADSRVQLLESTRAYQASAFRAALVAVWVATAYDLVSKLRQLAEDGDAQARTKIDSLDSAIRDGRVRDLQAFETGLLDSCRDDFEIIDARDHLALTRIYEDRHVCAHPAFVAPDKVFTPTPELVRAHIRTAVDAVLRHPPAPGRAVVQRFIDESQGTAWPAGREDLTAYLRERYFTRAKESTRRGLAELIVKGALGRGVNDELVVQRLARSARVLEDIDPGLLSAALLKVVRTLEEGPGLTPEEIVRMVGGLGDLSALWTAFPSTSISRVVACIDAAQWEDLAAAGVLTVLPPQEQVAAAVQARIDSATPEAVSEAIRVRPRASAQLVARALTDLSDARTWRSAEDRMRGEVIPLARAIGGPELRQVLDALKTNDQVRMASGMPQLLDELFEETKANYGAVPAWKEVAAFLGANGRDGDPTDWYAYPELVAKVADL